MPKKYHISFDTLDQPGRIVAVTVELGKESVRDHTKSFRVDLVNHPLYRQLEQYVLANPSGKK